MVVLFVRHEVSDYDTWKKGYDDAADMQRANGVRAEAVYRHDGDPNTVTVYHEFDSIDAAKAFVDAPALRDVMDELGVQGKPDVWFAHKA